MCVFVRASVVSKVDGNPSSTASVTATALLSVLIRISDV